MQWTTTQTGLGLDGGTYPSSWPRIQCSLQSVEFVKNSFHGLASVFSSSCLQVSDIQACVCTDSAVCSVYGDPHYRSYDGKRFSYQGTCRYLIASPSLRTTTPYFQVFGRNENRLGETDVSYVRYLEVVYGLVTVRLSRVSPETIGTVNVTVSKEWVCVLFVLRTILGWRQFVIIEERQHYWTILLNHGH